MFIGRENELKLLENLYKQDRFQLVILYGRRRVGKTALIRRFTESKEALIFPAQEVNETINLENFSRKIYGFFDLPITNERFGSWEEGFLFLAEKIQGRQVILAFDEFPYAVASRPGLFFALRRMIENHLQDTKLFMILSGNQVDYMENEVLGGNRPLFGKRTAKIFLEGFDFQDAAKMLPDYSKADKIKFFRCIGGTPHYLAQINPDETFEENITRLFFDISGYLYRELLLLLHWELWEPAIYQSVVFAIASGAVCRNEIADCIGEDPSTVNECLKVLINKKIVQRQCALGESGMKNREDVYQLADNCYQFWYQFVFPHCQEIESDYGGRIAAQTVFAGKTFVDYIENRSDLEKTAGV